jgi:hypothetical protein
VRNKACPPHGLNDSARRGIGRRQPRCRKGPDHLAATLEIRFDRGKPDHAIGDELIRNRADILAHHLVADAQLMMPVKSALGFFPPKGTARVESFVELRIETARQQLGEHGLGGEIDILHRGPKTTVVLHFQNVGQPAT